MKYQLVHLKYFFILINIKISIIYVNISFKACKSDFRQY